VAENLTESELVVMIVPDSGTRYLSKVYNDNWMRDNQFLEPRLNIRAGQVVREKARKGREVVSIPLALTVGEAVNLMREHSISQLPVLESGDVVGSISEARILDILLTDPDARSKPVAEYMEKPYLVISEDTSLTEVADSLGHEMSAILVQHARGFDIITRSDLIYFLTRQNTGKRS
jgi:cystathionine beta-synthase